MKNKKMGVVAIAGRPNVGKSTLLNQVLGSPLSIVTDKAQTTRDRLFGIHTDKTGQLVFIDTPGIHQAKEGGINAYMMDQVSQALNEPDLIWYVIEPKSELKKEKVVVELLKEKLKKPTPVFLIMNKSDESSQASRGRLTDSVRELLLNADIQCAEVLEVSALKKKGIPILLEKTFAQVKEGEFLFPDEDQISDRPMRYFVAEKIREQLLLCLGEELPYSCAVQIDQFKEKTRPPRIEATIYVERDSQKGMVVGQGGKKIKEIGSQARVNIEELMGCQVFLGLNVKVLKDWSKDAHAMKNLGYVFSTKKGSGKQK